MLDRLIDQIKTVYYSVIYGIENLYKYFFTIWKDRDWDSYYIYELLYSKLENMEQHFKIYGNFVGSGKVIKEIKTAKLLCKRLINDNYLEITLMPCKEIYKDSKLFESVPSIIHPGWHELKVIADKNEMKLYEKCCKHSDYMRKQDIHMLFEYMRKHVEKWWN